MWREMTETPSIFAFAGIDGVKEAEIQGIIRGQV